MQKIPYHVTVNVKESLERYVKHRLEPGGFLRSVLENDLMGAVGRADFMNIKTIPEICSFVYNELPSDCWGDKETVDNWLKGK